MLFPAVNSSNSIDPVGVVQAWAGVVTMHLNRGTDFSVMLDANAGERTLGYFQGGQGNYDGSFEAWVSNGDVYVWIAPGSGLVDYLAWAAIGLHAVADASCAAWVNTVWSGYLADIFSAIKNMIAPALTPASKVQITGFSLGGAMAGLVGQRLKVEGMQNEVSLVGFGMPRFITNSLQIQTGLSMVRFVNVLDPVDLIPPASKLTLDGGTVLGLPLPTSWQDFGRRYLIHENGTLEQVPDPPWPGDSAFAALLPFYIMNHHWKGYTGAVQDLYARWVAENGGTEDGGKWMNYANAIVDNWPISRNFYPDNRRHPAEVLAGEGDVGEWAPPQFVAPPGPRNNLILPWNGPAGVPAFFRAPKGIGDDPY